MNKFEKIWVTKEGKTDEILRDLKLVLQKNLADKIFLRQKNLSPSEYEKLANSVLALAKNKCELVIYNHAKIATTLKLNLHFSYENFIKFDKNELKNFKFGVSVHSLSDALQAQKFGASYVMAGHIFASLSHKSQEPRGLEFLKHIVLNLQIPVYAIGGINSQNIELIKSSGAKAACMMRGIFT
ncbi:MAG: thiamine phosphate synthase [Campylobacter sp.]|nr:thiamine phosphate synthase [Campylobacter sp.]